MNDKCLKPLCPDCFIENHIGHKRRKIIDVYREKKEEVDAVMEPLCKGISELEDKEIAMTEQVKKVKDDQKNQKEKIKAFTDLLSSSVTAYNAKLTALMENWTENKVRVALNTRRDFKEKVEKMPMADFVRKNTQVLLQAQHLNAY